MHTCIACRRRRSLLHDSSRGKTGSTILRDLTICNASRRNIHFVDHEDGMDVLVMYADMFSVSLMRWISSDRKSVV